MRRSGKRCRRSKARWSRCGLVGRSVCEFRCTIIIVDRFWGGFYGPNNYDALGGGIAQNWKDLDFFVNGDVMYSHEYLR